MTEEHAIYFLLNTDPTVSTLTGGRVYVQEPETDPDPQSFPYLVVSREDTDPLYNLSGKDKPDRISIVVDIWATHYGDAKQVLAAVKTALHGYRGLTDGILVYGLFHDEDFDIEDPDKFHLSAAFNLFA